MKAMADRSRGHGALRSCARNRTKSLVVVQHRPVVAGEGLVPAARSEKVTALIAQMSDLLAPISQRRRSGGDGLPSFRACTGCSAALGPCSRRLSFEQTLVAERARLSMRCLTLGGPSRLRTGHKASSQLAVDFYWGAKSIAPDLVIASIAYLQTTTICTLVDRSRAVPARRGCGS